MLQVINNWLIGNMGIPGEYQYQAMHLVSTVVVLLCVLAVAVYGRAGGTRKRKLLVAICLFQLGFELLWRVIYLTVKKDSLISLWPMYPCNLGGILIPIIALCNWKTGKKMFYLFGFIGGVLTFAMPEGIFCSTVLSFPILKSILQHTGLLLIPVLEYADGTYCTNLKHFGWCMLGCAIHLVNCEGIDRLLGFTGDYMFLRSGLPFVIPGVPSFITMSVFALAVMALLSFFSDRKALQKQQVTG